MSACLFATLDAGAKGASTDSNAHVNINRRLFKIQSLVRQHFQPRYQSARTISLRRSVPHSLSCALAERAAARARIIVDTLLFKC